MQDSVILYTRQGCHLCDDALELLRRYGLAVSCRDIDSNPELRARFDTCVPVVEVAGRIRFRGRINEVLLRRLLDARGDDRATTDEPAKGMGELR
jgi:glutaredoxin